MFTRKTALVGALAFGTLASAVYAAAMDPDVRARQEAMGIVGANTKTVAEMLKGEAAFDVDAAKAAFATIAEKAEMVPALFETKSNTDPEAEAKDAIWENWDDFVAKAGALKAAAEGGATIEDRDTLAAAMAPLSEACKACHSVYKE